MSVDFKCGIHFIDEEKKITFSTPDYEEWQKHIAEFEHEHQGFTACKDCGKQNIPHKVTMKLQPRQVPPAYCNDCLRRLKADINKLGNPNE